MLISREKTKEDYKKICLQLEYQLYTKDKEIERLNNIINNIYDDLEKTLEMNNKFKDNYGNKLLNIDIDHMKYLLNISKGEENEN